MSKFRKMLIIRALDDVMNLLDGKRHIARVQLKSRMILKFRCTKSIGTGFRWLENILLEEGEAGKAVLKLKDSSVGEQGLV